MTVPVLIITHSRPLTFKKVLSEVTQYTKNDILVICDGPRSDIEHNKQMEIFAVIDSYVSLGINIRLIHRDVNLGCKRAVVSAIDDFFNLYEYGIILEEDCVPSQRFFEYCEQMLSRFENDMRIGSVGGSNIIERELYCTDDITFTSISIIWGWATWKSRWKLYDREMKYWNSQNKEQIFHQLKVNSFLKRHFWCHIFNYYKNDPSSNAWDYQWILSMAMNSMLCVVPKENLISNQGFDQNATHTTSAQDTRNSLYASDTFQVKSTPDTVISNHQYDELMHSHWFKINWFNFIKRLTKKIIRVLSPKF